MTERGEDLLIKVRYEGVFYEAMELEDFPFDTQSLGVSFVVNCRTQGMTPVRLKVADDVHVDVGYHTFHQHQEWYIGQQAHVQTLLTGIDADRMFPSFEIAFVVGRRSGFFVYNVILPTACFAPTACLQICVQPDADSAVSDRASICLTILLTAAAYKFAISSLIPPISYLTVIDKYSLLNCLLVLLLCFEGCIFCVLAADDLLGSSVARTVDYIFFGLTMIVWLFLVLWVWRSARRSHALYKPSCGWVEEPPLPAGDDDGRRSSMGGTAPRGRGSVAKMARRSLANARMTGSG